MSSSIDPRFIELLGELRPELHRYCARMTGSIFDGEDVVQDTLAKAYDALGRMEEPPPLRPWLFRIAHNAALDLLRRYERRNVELVADVPEQERPEDSGIDPELVEAALAVFVELPPVQRSVLVMKDVLDHSLDEIATTLGMSVGAVKAALSRARKNVDLDARAPATSQSPALLARYVALFNARDWEGLRALLGEGARLDLVSRKQQALAEARYFDRYAEVADGEGLVAALGRVDGVPAIAMFGGGGDLAYYVLVEQQDERVTNIRDFRYVPYIARTGRFERA